MLRATSGGISAISIWRKLAGAAADLSLESPIGTLFLGVPGYREIERNVRADNEVAFTVGVIALSAKMAKADGVVTKDEVRAFKEAFKVSDAEMRSAARVFNLAKQDLSGYETCADQLVTTFTGNRKLLEDVLEGLFHIATSDEALHPQEEQFRGQVAKRFGFTEIEFSYIKARHAIAAERNPYDVLGLESSVSDSEIKSHYRKLVDDNQPDKLVASACRKSLSSSRRRRLRPSTRLITLSPRNAEFNLCCLRVYDIAATVAESRVRTYETLLLE